MKHGIPGAIRGVTVLVLLVGLAGRAGAVPLNPLDFPLSGTGAFLPAAGPYTINTSGTPTLTGPGGMSLTGTVANGIAVFDFNAIAVGSAQVFTGTGTLPLALLSRGDVSVNGTIGVSGGGPSFIPAPPPFPHFLGHSSPIPTGFYTNP